MEPLPPDRRRYGDREIAKILKRASEYQRATPARPDPSGLTLAELEEIAAEAGIDPENVRRAVAEVSTDAEEGWEAKYLGAPLTFRLETTVPGEIPPDAFGGLIPVIQAGADTTGQATTVGKALTWASTGTQNARTLHILVMAEDGETRVQLEERSGQVALGFHMGFGFGSMGFSIPAGLALGGTAGVIPGVAAALGITGLGYLAGRTLYAFTTRRRRRKLERFFHALVDRVRAAIESRDAAALESGSTPALPSG